MHQQHIRLTTYQTQKFLIFIFQIFIIICYDYNFIYNVSLSYKNQDLRENKIGVGSQLKIIYQILNGLSTQLVTTYIISLTSIIIIQVVTNERRNYKNIVVLVVISLMFLFFYLLMIYLRFDKLIFYLRNYFYLVFF